MLSKITKSLAVLAVASVFLAGSAVAEPIVIKFSHVVAQDTPKGLAADFFKKRAEELTQGKVTVEVYPNSQLYKDKEEMEALQLGAVQMLAPSLAKFGPLGVKEFEVFDLPFIFNDYDDLHKVTKGPAGKALLDKLAPKGILGLAYWDNGFKSFSANSPIKTPDDLKGKKFRIQNSKVLEEQMRTINSNSHFVPKRAILNGIEGFIGSIGGCVTHSCSAFSARRSLASCFLGPLGSFRAH